MSNAASKTVLKLISYVFSNTATVDKLLPIFEDSE